MAVEGLEDDDTLHLWDFTSLSGSQLKVLSPESCLVSSQVRLQVIFYSLELCCTGELDPGAHSSAHDLALDNQFKQLQYIQCWLSASKASDAARCCLVRQYASYEELTSRHNSLILSRDPCPLLLSEKIPCCQATTWVMRR